MVAGKRDRLVIALSAICPNVWGAMKYVGHTKTGYTSMHRSPSIAQTNRLAESVSKNNCINRLLVSIGPDVICLPVQWLHRRSYECIVLLYYYLPVKLFSEVVNTCVCTHSKFINSSFSS